jgi:hypothetical protein
MGMGENVGSVSPTPTRHGGTSEQTAYQDGDELGGGLERVHGSCN